MRGQCKQDFEKYILNEYYDDAGIYHVADGRYDFDNVFGNMSYFEHLPNSMQWGVIVDFFASKRMIIDTQPLNFDLFVPNVFTEDSVWNDMDELPELEARAAAIEKATEIYNEKFADTK